MVSGHRMMGRAVSLRHLTAGVALGFALAVLPRGAGAETVISNIAYNVAAAKAGVGNLYLPEGFGPGTPVVLAIHGGGWGGGDRHSWAGVAEFFCRDLGFAVFNIEYRLTGAGPWPLCGNDCVAAANYLLGDDFKRRSGIGPQKIWVCGGSAGGHLALWTGLSLPPERVAGVVSISGIGDLVPDAKANPGRYVGLFGHAPTPAELSAASPLARVTPKAPPIFCSHAAVDAVVPAEASLRLVDACRKAGTPVEFYTYEKRDSGHSIWRPGSSPHRLHADIEAAIAKFVNRFEKRTEGKPK